VAGLVWRMPKLPKLPYHLLRAEWRRLFLRPVPRTLDYRDLVRGRTWACADLGAFPRPLPRLPGLEGVVLMEDRDPEFFLSFRTYDPDAPTGLNRHGPLRHWSTEADLLALVRGLQAQGIRVAIGFWNYGGWALHRKARWLRAHPEVKRARFTSHMNPFAVLREGGTYADYIGAQYRRLRAAFGFDGLMLGDGFCGFGSIWDPDGYRDEAATIPAWTALYRRIADAVHAAGSVLLAYDAMGLPYEEARRHGADYRQLAAAGLDILVYQSYPEAWGRHWLETYAPRFDLAASVRQLPTVRQALRGTATRLFYTLEISDAVERWMARTEAIHAQIEALDPLADGRLLVWANEVVSALPPAPAGARRVRAGRAAVTGMPGQPGDA
jgi:hypothetical protein